MTNMKGGNTKGGNMREWEIDFCFCVVAKTEEEAIEKATSIAMTDLETADIVAHDNGPALAPVKHWSNEDTAELILFDDGSIYTWDEKGAVCINKHGNIISSYWRGDDEPFDIRQTIWHDTYSAEELQAMTGDCMIMPLSWNEPSYDAIHYTEKTPKRDQGARALIKLVQQEVGVVK